MKVSTLINWAQGLTEFQTLNLTTLAIAQAVLDEIWALDVPQRMKNGGRWSPYLVTTAATHSYAYVDIASDIRKVIGIWKPGLSEVNALQDYNYPQASDHYQPDIRRRVYDADVFADNENRTLNFRTDPGATTTDWQIDYFVSAPILTEDSDIPLISESWVPRLFLPGYLSYLERDKAGQKGPNRVEFEGELQNYGNAIRHFEDVRLYNATDGFIQKSQVQPL
jgi:hypothetical protein